MSSKNTKNPRNKAAKKLNLGQTPPAQPAQPNNESNVNYNPHNQHMQSHFAEENLYVNQPSHFNPMSSQYQAFLQQNQFSPPQQNSALPYFPNPFSQHYQSPQQSQFSQQSIAYNQGYQQMLNEGMAHTQIYDQDESVEDAIHRAAAKKKGKKIQNEGDEEGGKGPKRCYTQEEDKILAEAYVRVTDEAKKGCDQTGEKYWEKICRGFNTVASERGLLSRPDYSLKNRMQRMRFEMVRWNQAIEHGRVNVRSGFNLVMEMEETKKHFMTLNKKNKNRAFGFQHVVVILNKCSKFNFTTTRKSMPQDFESGEEEDEQEEEGNEEEDEYRTPPHSTSQNASTHESGHTIHSGEKRSSSEVTSPSKRASKRPMGSKAAKLAEKMVKTKGKAKGNQYLGLEDGAQDIYRQMASEKTQQFGAFLEAKTQASLDRTRAIEEMNRLEMAKQEREQVQAEREHESRILNLDISLCATEEQRNNLIRMKQEIMDKWTRGFP